MPKQKSGGARAVAKKHQARQARRPKGYEAERQARLAAIGAPPESMVATFGWVARILAHDIWDAETDVGLPPEARREQVARLAPQLVKALEPARLSVKLEEYEKTIDELRERLRERSAGGAAAFDSAEAGGPRPAASIS